VSPRAAKAATDYTDGQWHRLHPLTPVLQGGLFVAAIIGVVLAGFWDALLTQVTALIVLQELPEEPTSELPPLPAASELLVFFGVAAVAILLGAGWLWLTWFLHTFRISEDVIEVRSGVIVRTYRKARRDRINSVSIWRQFVPRLLGLAKVEFQAAGSDANVTLSYLPEGVAKNLRRLVLDASPLAPTPAASGEAAVGETLVAIDVEDFDLLSTEEGEVKVLVPAKRLAGSLVVSLETVVFILIMAIITVGFIVTDDRSWWLGAIPAFLVYVAGLVRGWARANRFRLAVVGDSIRVSYGLLSTTAETLPPRRVHSVTLSQPWPWRLFGWWRVDARRAVTPGQTTNQGPSHTMVLPVGTIDDAKAVIELLVHQGVHDSGQSVVVEALDHGVDAVNADPLERHIAIHAHPLARFRLILSQPIHSMGIINDSVWLRTGFLIRRLTIVPLERIQSSGTFRGPWHLVLGLTGVEVHMVSGPGLTQMVGFDSDEARAFAETLSGATNDAVGHARRRDISESRSR
jgi:putative membrane protein